MDKIDRQVLRSSSYVPAHLSLLVQPHQQLHAHFERFSEFSAFSRPSIQPQQPFRVVYKNYLIEFVFAKNILQVPAISEVRHERSVVAKPAVLKEESKGLLRFAAHEEGGVRSSHYNSHTKTHVY
jgi:hypothetical protein